MTDQTLIGAAPADEQAQAGFDLSASDDPREMARGLREVPVMALGDGFNLITRREDIEVALRQPTIFSSSESAVNLGNIRPLIPLQIDPPMHVKYRRILDPMFAPRRMAALEPDIVKLVNELIDGFIEDGTVDFTEAVAVPLPSIVFLTLMGLPLEDLDQFLAMKEGVLRPPGETLEEQEPGRHEGGKLVYAYFEKFVEQWRNDPNPPQGLLFDLMQVEIDGRLLSDEEVLDVCFLFILAGLDTVTDSLNCIFAHLAQHPEHRNQIVDDPDIIASAVEELLRWESPVPAVMRLCVEDTEVQGCPIGSGDRVALMIASANTDDTDYPGFDTVDLERSPNPHLVFGGGVHRCLGSHLARNELKITMREIHRRIPHYSLAEGTVLEFTSGLRSLHHLPLVFPAGSPQS